MLLPYLFDGRATEELCVCAFGHKRSGIAALLNNGEITAMLRSKPSTRRHC
jgi:hypothetical protein